jgi:hypothetical protein
MSADSWTLEEFEEFLEFASPLTDLKDTFVNSLDWRQLRRLAIHYKLNIRDDHATYLSQIKAKQDRAIARRDTATPASLTTGTVQSKDTATDEEAQRLSAKQQVEQSDKDEQDVETEPIRPVRSTPEHQQELVDLEAKIEELKRMQSEILTHHESLKPPSSSSNQKPIATADCLSDTLDEQHKLQANTGVAATSNNQNDGGTSPILNRNQTPSDQAIPQLENTAP